MASGSADKSLQVWNMETNSKVWQFEHEDEVKCVQLHDRWLISSGDDKLARIRNLDTGIEIHRLVHEDDCNNFDLSPNKTILAVGYDSGVVLWDFKNGTKIKELNLGESPTRDLRFNPTGDRLVVGLYDGRVFKIDLAYDCGDKTEKT